MSNFDIQIKGQSMFPLILDGETVTFSNEKNLRVGDITLLKDSSGEYIIHRVTSLNPLRTKGDNTSNYDKFEAQEFFGKAVTIKKHKVDISLIGKSFWMRLYSELSKLRTKSTIFKMISYAGLQIVTLIFQIIYSKPKRHHISQIK